MVDFSRVELDAETQEFWQEVRDFIGAHVTPEMHARAAATGDGFDPDFYKALGQRGWLFPEWPVEAGGAGLDPVRATILERELAPLETMMVGRRLSGMVAIAIRRHAHEAIRERVLKGIATGDVMICLGYSEPDAGSDLASVRTRAVRDGDSWIIEGSKMWTTNAQNSQYTFLLARTNPDAPKHRGLTTFLVPLDLDGIEIQPIRTLGGERTNIVFYSGVRLDDQYRIGAVDDGWVTVHGPLDDEHGVTSEDDPYSLRAINGQGERSMLMMRDALVAAFEWASDDAVGRPLDDPLVASRLGRIIAGVEAVAGTPGILGRVAGSEVFIDGASELVELMGPAAALRTTTGSLAPGRAEEALREAQATAIYGGTIEVFKNMIAHRMLGMPR
jgi:alkylation response protein AidB-like acyl-CoA dehydrogenase